MTPGYFETIGATLKAGRLPTEADYRSGFRGAVISELAAQKLFGGFAVGQEFTLVGTDKTPWSVLGVIQNLRHGGPLSTTDEPQIFFPLQVTEDDLNTRDVDRHAAV